MKQPQGIKSPYYSHNKENIMKELKALDAAKAESIEDAAALLRDYNFDDINQVFPFSGADFYTWLVDAITNNQYGDEWGREFCDLIMRSPAWENLHAAQIAADFVEYAYSMEADK